MIAQIQEQLVRDSTATTGLTIHETYLIIAVAGLAAGIVTLFMYIKGLHHKHSQEHNENIEKMTVAMTNSTNAINNNTKMVDLLFTKIDNQKSNGRK